MDNDFNAGIDSSKNQLVAATSGGQAQHASIGNQTSYEIEDWGRKIWNLVLLSAKNVE